MPSALARKAATGSFQEPPTSAQPPRWYTTSGAAAATSAAITQVTSSIRNIARSAETLQEATTGTAQHLEELTRTVSSVAAYAAESSSLSQDSSRAADEGMLVVREASAAMDAISTSFESLEECVARQTAATRIIRIEERELGIAQAGRLSLEPGSYVVIAAGAELAGAPEQVEDAVKTAEEGEWDLAPSDLSMLMALASVREVGGTVVREREGTAERLAVYLPSVAA